LFSFPRRKLQQESNTTRIAERNFTDRNITRSRHISHRQRLASPPDCFPSPAANCNRKATQLASPNARKQRVKRAPQSALQAQT
jgi:hypothetical protein